MIRRAKHPQCERCQVGRYCPVSSPSAGSRQLHHVYVAAGNAVQRQGGAAQTVHMVCAGSLAVETGGYASDRLMLDVVGQGRLVGLEDLSQPTHAYSVIARGPAMLARISTAEFAGILRADSQLTMTVVGDLSAWARYLAIQLPTHLSGTVERRLAGLLLDLAERDTPASPVPIAGSAPAPLRLRFSPPLRRQELAAMVGSSAESVSRQMQRWLARGLVQESRKGELVLTDPDRLRRIARRWAAVSATAATAAALDFLAHRAGGAPAVPPSLDGSG